MEFIVRFPDGREATVPAVLEFKAQRHDPDKVDHRRTAEAAARKIGYRLPYKDREQYVPVKLDRLVLKDGKVVRQASCSLSIQVYHEEPTEADWEGEAAEILRPLPLEFHSAVSALAYEDGHSAGMAEVLLYLRKYARALVGPCDEYARRLAAEH